MVSDDGRNQGVHRFLPKVRDRGNLTTRTMAPARRIGVEAFRREDSSDPGTQSSRTSGDRTARVPRSREEEEELLLRLTVGGAPCADSSRCEHALPCMRRQTPAPALTSDIQ